jgi:uncharacterized protein
MSGEPGLALESLHVYPIKSCGGYAPSSAEVEERGFRLDRRWMLVDEGGTFVSQREAPRLALVKTSVGPEALRVEAPGMPPLEVPLVPEGRRMLSTVWSDTVETIPAGEGADRWFGRFLGARCRLVYLPDDSIRLVDPRYGTPGDHVSLADGFPFLLASAASLEDLNKRLGKPVPINRFRPNLVVRGCGPFAEDGWRRVRIGGIAFRVAKPCARCVITTVDQQTGVAGKEPLRTLARFRKFGGKALFGQNLIPDSPGTLRVGDPLEVLE